MGAHWKRRNWIAVYTILSMAGFFGHAQDEQPTAAGPLASLTELVFLKSGDPLKDWNPERTWRSADGKSLSATILHASDDGAVFRLANGSDATIPFDRLSESDREFIREWKAISVYFNTAYKPTRKIANTVEAEIRDGAFAKTGKIHETRNFRFECDEVLAADVVRDFSRMFEATYYAVQENPLALAIADPPDGKFLVKLFSTDQGYLAAGGQEDAAGIYLISERTMLVPLSSLGLVEGPRGFRKARNFDPRTLIHETTHALTHQWLNFMPLWFAEGFADYIAAIPYEDGVMDFGRIDEGIGEQYLRKLGRRAGAEPLPEPRELVLTGDWEFMAKPEPVEEPLVIRPVEPFQITVVKNDGTSEGGKSAEDPPDESETDPSLFPPIEPPGDDGPAVVRRYVASMLLLHYFFSKGEADKLREYLFAHIFHAWDSRRYLAEYDAAFKEHKKEVDAQISAFNDEVGKFNDGLKRYNQAVDEYNAGRTDVEPKLPAEPVIPGALKVPEILSNPRAPDAFSRSGFRETAVEKYLALPYSIPTPVVK